VRRAEPSPALAAVRRQDAGDSVARPTPADAFRAAVATVTAPRRLDMGRLAAELGVSKATLYRWTGTREQLLAEVVRYQAETVLDRADRATADRRGVERIVEILRAFVTATAASPTIRFLVRNEPHVAMRILTQRGGLVQVAMLDRLVAVLEAEQRRGALTLRAPAPTLAYAMIRVTEGFVYREAGDDIDPDVEDAVAIVRLLLADPA
jgi:AcrR family transcriptional regulator